MTRNILIAFLRNDLRLTDHPIFSQFASSSSQRGLENVTHILPVYVFDQQYIEVGGLNGIKKGKGPGGDQHGARTRVAGFWRTGKPRVQFMTRSVYDLQSRLQSIGSDLSIWSGHPHLILHKIVKALQKNGDNIHGVWYGEEPHTEEKATEKRIKKALAETQVPVRSFQHRSLILPKDLPFPLKDLPDVFTQFRKRVEAPDMYNDPLPAPEKLKPFPELPLIENEEGVYNVGKQAEQEVLQQLLSPLEKDPGPIKPVKDDVNADKISALPFKGGETEALKRLEHYFTGDANSHAANYKETRNGMLGVDYSSKFSAALAHGLLSPRTIAKRAEEVDKKSNSSGRGGGYWIIFELLWRDYFFFVSEKYGSQLYTLKGIEESFDSKAAQEKAKSWNAPDSFENEKDPFVRWATAETGVPLIDANMKELALTGFMSNRGRQNVASLLTKDLYYDWRLGAEWFESLLVDYDPSSNYGNWQYVAGVGNDPRASRQFNPIKQGKDYDREAKYLKTWLPALEQLSNNDAHHPWVSPSGSPDGYPAKPVCESPAWKGHYGNNANRRGGIRGGGGGRSKRGGRGGGGQSNGQRRNNGN
ncbi:cryptochrome [Meira miltonrushii]|uniref:Cryptochrome DASH n=1 Tax=Meira miltonrushii TaxID=1280837 RepID=A0A316VBE7_9BASI|nr:cryptochrome [Meira miltonrushii]PWN34967.1 cryptochrome [Meira miltonrushii]